MDVVRKRHIESHRLFELAEMSRSIDQPDWVHISNCVECGTAFLMLKSVLERSAEVEIGWRACIAGPPLSFE